MGEQWYVFQNGHQLGPYTEEELKACAEGGQLRRKDLIWSAGLADWIEAGTKLGLFTGPPPPPSQSIPPVTARDVLNTIDGVAVGVREKYRETVKRAEEDGYENRQWLGTIGIGAGVVVGFFAANYFPLWGGIALLGEPTSEARMSLVPGHIVFFVTAFSALGYWRGLVLDKQKK